MRWILVATLVIFALAGGSNIASAKEKRIALLIDNQSYDNNIGPLTNPHNDVEQIRTALKKVNFKVTVVKDAGYGQILKSIRKYAKRLRRAGPDAVGFSITPATVPPMIKPGLTI